jgi:hypothetical protein
VEYQGRLRIMTGVPPGRFPAVADTTCSDAKGFTIVKKLLALSLVCGLALTGCQGSSSTSHKATQKTETKTQTETGTKDKTTPPEADKDKEKAGTTTTTTETEKGTKPKDKDKP